MHKRGVVFVLLQYIDDTKAIRGHVHVRLCVCVLRHFHGGGKPFAAKQHRAAPRRPMN